MSEGYQEARERWFAAYKALLCAVHHEATGCPSTALIDALAPYVVAYSTEGGVAVATPPTVTEALAALQAASRAIAETDDEYQQRTRRFIDCLAFHADPDGSGANVADLGPIRSDAYGWSVDAPVEVRRHDEIHNARALAMELAVGCTPERLAFVLAVAGALALMLAAPPARHGGSHIGRKPTMESRQTAEGLYQLACECKDRGVSQWAARLATAEDPGYSERPPTEKKAARDRLRRVVIRYADRAGLSRP